MAMLRILLIIIFLIAALAVTIIVLLQEGKSAGLGSLGGMANSGSSYWEKNKKYSLEGKFEKWTKITAVVFVLAAFLIMLIPNQSATAQITTPGESTAPAASATTDANATEDAAPAESATPEESVAPAESTAPTANADATAEASPAN